MDNKDKFNDRDHRWVTAVKAGVRTNFQHSVYICVNNVIYILKDKRLY